MAPDKLYEKYEVSKRDASPVDPQAVYFVLRLDTDLCARCAALHYAECIRPGQPGLAEDLRDLVESVTPVQTATG